MRKLFIYLVPTPLLSAALLGSWLALVRSVNAAQVLLGVLLALTIPRITTNLRSSQGRVRRPLVVGRFLLTVAYDALKSNFEVALGVVAWPWRKPHPEFVIVPLELRDPHGLAALAIVATVVPGTVWSELALDRKAVMIHVWDVPDEQAFITRFKARYEQPLREIFE